jgi:hypothetical protein
MGMEVWAEMQPFSCIIAVGGYPSNAAIFAVFVEGEANLLIKPERNQSRESPAGRRKPPIIKF